jgi:gliding motility-associated-like protein
MNTTFVSRSCFIILFAFATVSMRAQSMKDSLFVPNIFTPNADGLNDVFKPVLSFEGKIQSYHLEVYDRFGLKLLETNKSNLSWDGRTTSGMACPDGTYFYIIQVTINSTKFEHKGFIQLIR